MRLNPVLRRELVERWRGRRAFVTLSVYLGLLAALVYALYRIAISVLAQNRAFGGSDAALAGPSLGRFLLESLLFAMLLLVLFVTPGYAAAQISGERERRTLQLLRLTLLRPVQIVLGKLGASVAWVTVLVVAGLPIGAATLFLGGVALPDLLRASVLVVVVAVGVAGMALGVSSMVRRTTAAIVVTYGLVLALVLGTAVVAGLEVAVRSRQFQNTPTAPVTLYLNPFYGLADAATTTSGFGANGLSLPAPLTGISFALPDSPAFQTDQAFLEPGERPPRQPVWLVVSALYLALGGLGVAVATRRVRTAGGTGRRHGRADGEASRTPEPPAAPPTSPAPPSDEAVSA